jgi:hypothetical protein
VELHAGINDHGFAASRIHRNLLLSCAVLLAAFALAQAPEVFDRPVTRLINDFANRSWLFDYFVAASSKYYTFSGVALMAMIWFCWFDDSAPENRARILVGTLASLGAGIASRFLQHTLPTHPRPYYDLALGFHRPLSLEPPGRLYSLVGSNVIADLVRGKIDALGTVIARSVLCHRFLYELSDSHAF